MTARCSEYNRDKDLLDGELQMLRCQVKSGQELSGSPNRYDSMIYPYVQLAVSVQESHDQVPARPWCDLHCTICLFPSPLCHRWCNQFFSLNYCNLEYKNTKLLLRLKLLEFGHWLALWKCRLCLSLVVSAAWWICAATSSSNFCLVFSQLQCYGLCDCLVACLLVIITVLSLHVPHTSMELSHNLYVLQAL